MVGRELGDGIWNMEMEEGKGSKQGKQGKERRKGRGKDWETPDEKVGKDVRMGLKWGSV